MFPFDDVIIKKSITRVLCMLPSDPLVHSFRSFRSFVRFVRSYEGTVPKKALNGAHFHDDVIKRKHSRVSGPLWGGHRSQMLVTRSFDVFFDLRLNKRLSKQSIYRWFETSLRSLRRHRYVMINFSHSEWSSPLSYLLIFFTCFGFAKFLVEIITWLVFIKRC